MLSLMLQSFLLTTSLNWFFPAAFATQEERTIEFKQEFKPLVRDEAVELWIPIPMDLTGYQTVLSQRYSSNADQIKIENIDSVPLLHVTWIKASKPEFEITHTVRIQDQRKATPEPSSLKGINKYISPTAHVQTDGIVRETASKIVGNLSDTDKKAEAIYNWIVDKSIRDPNVRGCGLGDVKSTLKANTLAGKCADLNSLFVGLARAAKIPAREVFGIRVDSSIESPSLGKTGDVSKGQHCRAEYYSENMKAWVPVDPADIRKVILEEKLSLDDPKVESLKRKFFGYWEGNWIAFNHGRDFFVNSLGKKIPINYFMYPLLVSKGLNPDGMDPKEVTYALTASRK
ncbi:MAG: transglutaminase domain-containing protein [Bdellovibrionales bacterium]|nr:transglutaminase domain-containing protein [Bdellovibrionales bacterium]